MENNKDFGGRRFSFGVIPPTKAIKVECSVVRVIGEPLFKTLVLASDKEKMKGKTKDETDKMGVEMLSMVVGLLGAKLDDEEILSTMKICFEYVSCDGNRITSIDETFIGRNREIWEVFIYALRFNFFDFFPASLLDSIKQKLPKLS